jgi:predicted permease
MTATIVQTLLPVFGLILLGVVLRHVGFLDQAMEQSLNKFCYWIALPVFIVTKMAQAPGIDPGAARTIAALIAVTLLLAGAGVGVARLLRLPPRSRGTFVQAGFRGNLAYVGIPVIAYALSGRSESAVEAGVSLAVLTMTPAVLLYNLLAVAALEWDRRHDHASHPFATTLRSTLHNPLVLACLAGLVWNAASLPVPPLLRKMTDPLGATAFPLALAAIGARLRGLPWKQAGRGLLGACLVKNALGLAFAWAICRVFPMDDTARLVVYVLSATPSAVAAYVLVDQLDGDRDLAASAIAGTTVAAIPGLAAALALAL